MDISLGYYKVVIWFWWDLLVNMKFELHNACLQNIKTFKLKSILDNNAVSIVSLVFMSK